VIELNQLSFIEYNLTWASLKDAFVKWHFTLFLLANEMLRHLEWAHLAQPNSLAPFTIIAEETTATLLSKINFALHIRTVQSFEHLTSNTRAGS
jgi:hypothetical protein